MYMPKLTQDGLGSTSEHKLVDELLSIFRQWRQNRQSKYSNINRINYSNSHTRLSCSTEAREFIDQNRSKPQQRDMNILTFIFLIFLLIPVGIYVYLDRQVGRASVHAGVLLLVRGILLCQQTTSIFTIMFSRRCFCYFLSTGSCDEITDITLIHIARFGMVILACVRDTTTLLLLLDLSCSNAINC